MKGLVLVALAAALAVFMCGCPQTTGPAGGGEMKLLAKFTDGKGQVAMLFVTARGCPPSALRIKEFLQGIENLYDGAKLIAVNADEDRDVKEGYGIRTYPKILFFDKEGKLVARYGPELSMDEAKKLVEELGARPKGEGGEPEEEAQPPAQEPPAEEGGEAPPEGENPPAEGE
jgi:thiol-disulfide isomerase/thioredoxin